jgi:hypothetical protein
VPALHAGGIGPARPIQSGQLEKATAGESALTAFARHSRQMATRYPKREQSQERALVKERRHLPKPRPQRSHSPLEGYRQRFFHDCSRVSNQSATIECFNCGFFLGAR